MVRPGERGLTRRIFNASTDRHLDGWSGRKLVLLLRDRGLRNVSVEPIVDVDAGGSDHAWLSFLASRGDIAVEAGSVSAEEATQWWHRIAGAAAAGRYFFSVTQFAAMGDVAEPD